MKRDFNSEFNVLRSQNALLFSKILEAQQILSQQQLEYNTLNEKYKKSEENSKRLIDELMAENKALSDEIVRLKVNLEAQGRNALSQAEKLICENSRRFFASRKNLLVPRNGTDPLSEKIPTGLPVLYGGFGKTTINANKTKLPVLYGGGWAARPIKI